jgi:hypothetical protein
VKEPSGDRYFPGAMPQVPCDEANAWLMRLFFSKHPGSNHVGNPKE